MQTLLHFTAHIALAAVIQSKHCGIHLRLVSLLHFFLIIVSVLHFESSSETARPGMSILTVPGIFQLCLVRY